MKNYKFLFIILFFIHLFLISSLAADTQLKVGVYQNKPLVFFDSEGNVRGIYIDVIENIALKEGWKLKYIQGTWQQCLERLEKGEIDLLVSIAFSKSRSELYDFTNEILLSNWGKVYIQKSSNIESILDLENKTIAALEGDIYYSEFKTLIERFNISCNFIEVDEYNAVFELVENKKADAGLVNRLYGILNEKNFYIDRSPMVFSPIELRFAAPKKSGKYILNVIDKNLVELKSDKKSIYYQSINKWIEIGEVGKWKFPPWLKWLLTSFGVLLVLFLIYQIILRVQIKAKTDELILKNKELQKEIEGHTRTESLLQESEKKYRELANLLPQIVFEIDENGSITFANLNGFEAFSYSKEDFEKGLNAFQMFVSGEKDKLSENIKRVINGEITGGIEYTALRKDGRTFPVVIYSSSIIHENKSVGVRGIAIDITEQKHVEEMLREERNLLRTLIDNLPEFIYVKDTDSRFIIGNTPVARFMGTEKSENLIGKTDFDFYPKDLAEGFYYDEKKIIQTGKPIIQKEEPIIDSEGRERWISTTKIPLRDNKGTIVGIIGMGFDFTERKQMEEDLRRKETHFRTIFNSAAIGIALVDLQGRPIESNRALQKMLGYNEEELKNMVFTEFTHPKDVTADLKLYKELIKGKRKYYQIEKRYIRKNKQIVWGHLTVSLVRDVTGNPLFAIGMVEDITKRKLAEESLQESEKRFQFLFENMLNGVAYHKMVFDKKNHPIDYIFLDVNKTFERLTGLKKEDVLGKKVTEVIPGIRDYEPDLINFYGNVALTRKEDKLEIFFEPLNKWFSISAYSPKKRYFVAVFDDITERIIAEKEKEKIQKQLFQAQKIEAIGRLTGGIAHDFNNILTAIIGFSDYLLTKLDKKDFSYPLIREISEAGRRAASLTHQLLAFSRKQILQPRVLNINEIISDMDKMLHRIIGEDIDLVTKLEPDLGNVKIDPSQIEQVIMNLAVNAKDAMPHGGKLTIETTNVYLDEEYTKQHNPMKPGFHVMLAVSDNGIGMDKETQAKIFEPFFTTKEEGKGTGLGLSTVYGIIKQSEGYIWVYSEPGNGTTFKIYFPLVKEEVDLRKVAKPQIQSILGTETILVVEDDDIVREIVTNSLKTLGYTILEAHNGEDALLLFKKDRKQSIDLIVTDIVMPQMSGGELIKQLRKKIANIKVLFISGYSDSTIVHHGILDEGIPFLQKPFTMNDLGKKVREVLENK